LHVVRIEVDGRQRESIYKPGINESERVGAPASLPAGPSAFHTGQHFSIDKDIASQSPDFVRAIAMKSTASARFL